MTDILFDCDPGHDDALALMIALAHPAEVRLLGITTVAGNQTLEKVTKNTLMLLEHLMVPDLPVFAGCARPIRYDAQPQPAAHGESGMDGPVLPSPQKKAEEICAVDFMRSTLKSAKNPVTIVAIGPLTNVGTLLFLYPELRKKIQKICIMGGSLTTGNVLPKAEFNIYHDPDAARIVFRSGVPLVMSGLEVCASGAILLREYAPLRHRGKASRLACDLLDFYCGYARDRGWDRTPIFDITTVIQLLHPELFTSERFIMDVEIDGELCRGMTVADTRPPIDARRLNAEVLMTVTDRAAFVQILFDSLSVLDAHL